VSDTNTVIIKLHPEPEEYVEAETAFLRAVGLCVTQWAFVDRQLFRLFRFGIGASTHRAAIVYYEQNTLGQRLRQVDNLLKSSLSDRTNERYRATWKELYDRINDLLPARNIIVHQPVRRTGTASEGKAIYVYGIYIEPYQRYLNKKHKGLNDKEELKTQDLTCHAIAVGTLEADLIPILTMIDRRVPNRDGRRT
jgi:hypothetical protein